MPKQPQDHKPKVTNDEEPECFSFQGPDGTAHTLAPTMTVLTPGFIRKHRNAGQMDMFYTLVEQLADERALDAFDNLSFEANAEVIKDFDRHVGQKMGVKPGE